MLKIFKKTDSIIAITNDGPKGPSRKAKLGSYKIALRSDAQIIAMSCNSTTYWEAGSWDRLRLPRPFGNIYIDFSRNIYIQVHKMVIKYKYQLISLCYY